MKSEMDSAEKRLRILGDDEIEALYSRPQFTDEERGQYFALSQIEREWLQELRSIGSRTYFILQLGYFKAKRLFFSFALHEAKEDVQYILEQHFPHGQLDDQGMVNKRTILRQRHFTLELLKQLDEQLVHVYLLCFVYHRYQRLYDNLLNSLIYHVRRYGDEAKGVAKEQVYAYRMESNQNLQKAGQVLKLFTDDTIAAHIPFQAVQAKAFAILERQQLDRVADHIATNARFDETAFQWQHIDLLAHQFKRRLRPILLAVDFAASRADNPLIEAVHFLQAALRKERALGQYTADAFPIRFVPDTVQRYLYAQDVPGRKRFLPDRYEFLVYRLLRNGLEAGDIFCRDSVRFRSFEDDLLNDQRWQEREALMAETGLTILMQPIQRHLAALEERLETRLAEVNQRIATGKNEHFQIKRRGQQIRWTLQYPRSGEPMNHPFFDAMRQVDIGSVLHFANQKCRFMEAFEHVLGRYVKQEVDDILITACLVAWGTNMGLGRMGEISDIRYHTLATTSDNFIRLETLKEANDRVSNAIAELPILRHHNLGETVHSSSDGQKFETRIHTLNARHSPKYFGLKKGIVSYTLVANHIPVNARIIGANEHESHYVFDLLFNNTTDIQPAVHSTDAHGANEVNFAILHLFGYQFAPRYQDIALWVQTPKPERRFVTQAHPQNQHQSHHGGMGEYSAHYGFSGPENDHAEYFRRQTQCLRT